MKPLAALLLLAACASVPVSDRPLLTWAPHQMRSVFDACAESFPIAWCDCFVLELLRSSPDPEARVTRDEALSALAVCGAPPEQAKDEPLNGDPL